MRLPEIESDFNYADQLAAYDAQNATIEALAEQFMSSGMNFKDLLVDMMMTPWFRAGSIDAAESTPSKISAHGLANIGSRKLLTPERLQQKTAAITGFTWGNFFNFITDKYDTGLGSIYSLYFGGINSASITKRSTEITPLMSSVAMTHALESACPIVLRDFIRPDNERLLFSGIDGSETPELNGDEIRAKLVELHRTFLGISYEANSEEITDVYNLFVDSMAERTSNGSNPALFWSDEECQYEYDQDFFEGTGIDSNYRTALVGYQGFPSYEFDQNIIIDFLSPLREESNYSKQAWVTVITYLMTHYYYLYE